MLIYTQKYDIAHMEVLVMHLKQITCKCVCRLYLYDTYYKKDPYTGIGKSKSRIPHCEHIKLMFTVAVSYNFTRSGHFLLCLAT